MQVETLDPRLVQWVAAVIGSDGTPSEVRGLRDGGAPWLLRFSRQDVVLRIGSGADPSAMRVERAGLDLAADSDIPAPRVVAADIDHDPPLLLIEAVTGSSAIPRECPTTRLRTLGASAAALHRIAVPPDLDLPRRERPIDGVDFEALRRMHPAEPLLVRAESVASERRPASDDGFVHGDLWQGNSMWDGETLVALIDWDCAGVGPAGVDLGSLRCDAALCFGHGAPTEVLVGWEAEAGRAADDVAYWDVVAALSTPPDMGWFVSAIGGQGRTDLTREILLDRRDEFLRAALDRL